MPYDPVWAVRYPELARILRAGLGRDWDLEHVGSTSVPGLSAKPVIDLALGQPPGHDLSGAVPRLRAMGWTEPVDVGDHKAAFMLYGATRTAIAHVFTHEQWPVAHVRLLAEWLRSHEVDRGEYERLKRGLIADDVWGSAYTQAKTEFVVRIVNAARGQRGLPPARDL